MKAAKKGEASARINNDYKVRMIARVKKQRRKGEVCMIQREGWRRGSSITHKVATTNLYQAMGFTCSDLEVCE